MPDPEVKIEQAPLPPASGLLVDEKLTYLEATILDLQKRVEALEGKVENVQVRHLLHAEAPAFEAAYNRRQTRKKQAKPASPEEPAG